MPPIGTAYVRIRLDRSSEEFIMALSGLMHAIGDADPALLEDSIADAHERLVAVLQGRENLALEPDDDEGW